MEKYQGQKKKEELEKTWKIKEIISVTTGGLRIAIPKLEKWIQQIPRIISDIFIQESVLLGTAKMLRKTFNSQAPARGSEVEDTMTIHKE